MYHILARKVFLSPNQVEKTCLFWKKKIAFTSGTQYVSTPAIIRETMKSRSDNETLVFSWKRK